ncbi:hypothetical protein NX059_002848 [Plenodomus lindquistii]|nr:hypothetical protein NX059_002848 [Plenodomus lindquistii]
MAKFFTSMLALSALSFVNVAVASTAFSSDVAPAPSSVEVPIITSTVLSTTLVPAASSSEATSTTCTTVTVTTAVTSTVMVHSSIASAMPDNSTTSWYISSGTALPTHANKSTVVVTHTANHSSGASTGGFKPTATASIPPEYTNAATNVDFGYAALAIAIGAAVLAI